MPWSPVPLFPNVINYLAERGYKVRVSSSQLRLALITVLGASTEKTIRRDMSLMVELGWIISYDGGVIYDISQGVKTNNFPPHEAEPIEPEPDVVPEEKAGEHLDALLPGSEEGK